MFVKACNVAAQIHADQRQKNGKKTPYINHPIEVAYMLSGIENVGDQSILAAAVLHDTVEDTPLTSKDIEMLFGGRVARLVKECSDDKSLPKVERKKAQIEHARVISDDAKKIKMADKLSNMLGLVDDSGKPANWSEAEVRGYVIWGLAVVREMKNAAPRIYKQMCSGVFAPFDIDPEMPQEDLEVELEKYYALIE